jgi:bifunctional non-homologous end joining protein LigD
VRALAAVPDETVIDGEVVATDDTGRPSFNALQNSASSKLTLFYYVFDLLILAGHNIMPEPLSKRCDLLQRRILPKLSEPIRNAPELRGILAEVQRRCRLRDVTTLGR